MRKTEAIALLGGSIPAVAEAVGVTYQAVDKWPEDLSRRITDRVQAALWRKSQQPKQRKPKRRSSKSTAKEA